MRQNSRGENQAILFLVIKAKCPKIPLHGLLLITNQGNENAGVIGFWVFPAYWHQP
jgi:hypothetical protein